jgi:hypothetical protein
MTSDVQKIGENRKNALLQKLQTYFIDIFFVLCSYVLMSHKVSKIRWVKSCYLHK